MNRAVDWMVLLPEMVLCGGGILRAENLLRHVYHANQPHCAVTRIRIKYRLGSSGHCLGANAEY